MDARVVMCCLLAPIGLAACGSDRAVEHERRGAPNSTTPVNGATVIVEPVRIEGGAFVEGFVAGTDIDGGEKSISRMAPLAEAVTATVEPGERHVRALVYPCEASCRPWSEFARRYEAELAEPGKKLGRLRSLVTECSGVVVARAGETVRVAPVIDLRGGPECATEPAPR